MNERDRAASSLIKVPRLIASSRSLGGGAILTPSIVWIHDAVSQRELCVDPSYTPAEPPAAAVAEPEAAGMSPPKGVFHLTDASRLSRITRSRVPSPYLE